LFCPNCGAENSKESQFCGECGISLIETTKPVQLESESEPFFNAERANLVRRSYLIWFLLTMVISAFNFVYLYFNFQDLNELDKATPNKEGPPIKTESDKIIIYMVLSLFIPFFMFPVVYWKYDKLYKYLKANPMKQKTMPISGKKRLTYQILMFFFSLIGGVLISVGTYFYDPLILYILMPLGSVLLLVGMGLGIYIIVCDYRWQEALNERILQINPNAPEKSLF
jgi:hypothetical protein